MNFDCVKHTGVYDPDKDIMPLAPVLPLSLSEVMSTGVVPPDASPDDYAPEVDNTSMIVGRAQDVFSALRAQKQIVSSSKVVSQISSTAQEGTEQK